MGPRLSRDPLLGFFYGMDQQTAQGTALIMVVPNVLWAFSRYQRRFGVDLRMAATIAGSALIGPIRQPVWRPASTIVLRLAFAVFLATTTGTVAYRTWRGGARVGRGRKRAWGWVTVVGVIGGVVSGFFGVGGAFIVPPMLTTFFGLRQLEAQRSGPGARVAERIYCVADLCRGRSDQLACRITARARCNRRDLRHGALSSARS